MNSTLAFQAALCKESTKNNINQFINSVFPENTHGVESAVNKLKNIVTEAAKNSLKTAQG